MGSEAKAVSDMTIKMVAGWCGGVLVEEQDPFDPSAVTLAFNLKTQDGEIERAHVGDTIIKNHDGTFTIWKG